MAALDSLSEIGQRALIRAYAHAGRRPEALRQYRTCAEILKRELGVAPDAETQALANEIAHAGTASEGAAVGRLAEMPDRDTAALPNALAGFPAKPAIQRHLAPIAKKRGQNGLVCCRISRWPSRPCAI